MGRASSRKQQRRREDVVTSDAPPVADSLGAVASSWGLSADDATSTETYAPDFDVKSKYAETPASLLHRGLQGGVRVTKPVATVFGVLLWVTFVGWLYQQDNAAGKLDTDAGMMWFFTRKAFWITVFFGFALLIMFKIIDHSTDEAD